MLKGAFLTIPIPLIWLVRDCISSYFHLIFGCCACFFTGAPLPQPRYAAILPEAARPKPTQSSPARPAKRVGGDTKQKRVQGTVDIPQGKRQVGFQDCVDRKDGVRPDNHVDLHQWRGNVWKVANKKGHHDCTWWQNMKDVDSSILWS